MKLGRRKREWDFMGYVFASRVGAEEEKNFWWTLQTRRFPHIFAVRREKKNHKLTHFFHQAKNVRHRIQEDKSEQLKKFIFFSMLEIWARGSSFNHFCASFKTPPLRISVRRNQMWNEHLSSMTDFPVQATRDQRGQQHAITGDDARVCFLVPPDCKAMTAWKNILERADFSSFHPCFLFQQQQLQFSPRHR